MRAIVLADGAIGAGVGVGIAGAQLIAGKRRGLRTAMRELETGAMAAA